MDKELIKQRNRRRKRALRMQAQKSLEKNEKDGGDSGEDEVPVREKPSRPPNRRKKPKEPIVEEDIVDGFAILGFKSYEDLEVVIKLANKNGIKQLTSPVIDEQYRLERELQRELQRDLLVNKDRTNNHVITANDNDNQISNNKPPVAISVNNQNNIINSVLPPPKEINHSINQNNQNAVNQISNQLNQINNNSINNNQLLQPPSQIQQVNNVNKIRENNQPQHGLALSTHDAGTSDDSGRASERLTSSSVPPSRDPDSSRDRLSDASSRCSSGKGYICDSEGDDDKGSDAGSVLFASTQTTRKHEFPPSLSNGDTTSIASPVPTPTSPSLAPPAPSPAPAALPPPHTQQPIANAIGAASNCGPQLQTPTIQVSHQVTGSVNTITSQGLTPNTLIPSQTPIIGVQGATQVGHNVVPGGSVPLGAQVGSMGTPIGQPVGAQIGPGPLGTIPQVPIQPKVSPIGVGRGQTPPPSWINPPPATSVPVTMPQPAPAAAPAPVVHIPALDSTSIITSRTESPAVATSANAAVAPNQPVSGTSYPSFPPGSLYAPYAVGPYTAPSPAPPASAAVVSSAATVVSSTVITTGIQPSSVINSVASTLAVTITTTSHRDTVTSTRSHSPRGHSPNRERDSYSSNVSSLSRGSLTPFSTTASTITSSSSLIFSKPTTISSVSSNSITNNQWPNTIQTSAAAVQSQVASQVSVSQVSHSQLSPANKNSTIPRPTPPLPPSIHPFSGPMFAPPLPPVSTNTVSPLANSTVPNPNPFSAESLFQSNQADMLRRELDNRFLASQDRSLNVGPPPYLRTEMHQHQHHHTHVHQHTTSLLPPPPSSTLFPAPLRYVNKHETPKLLATSQANTFKDIPKLGSVDSPFYRQNIGLSSYPGYTPGFLNPGLGGPTPFVPPNHLPTFQPKQPISDASKLKPIVKTGKWNAMHVRIAWEIYHHQQKQQSEVKSGLNPKADLLRPPSHLFPGSLIHSARPHELSAYPPSLAGHRPPTFDPNPHGSLFSSPSAHLSSGISPFGRYGTAFNTPGSPFMSPFAQRDLPPIGPLHDPWGRITARTVPGFPQPVPQPAWGLKPDPSVIERREQEERERERERERLRREREERERREREEKQRKQLEQQQQERERERRERERKEMERRELERERERERERLLHEQRIAESNKQAAALAARDRSPLRNGTDVGVGEVRVKEEPRPPKEEDILLGRTDHRYHNYLNRHPTLPPHSVLDRSRTILGAPPPLAGPPLGPPHYPPAATAHWPDPYGYRFDPLRYNPLMEAAIRAEDERLKLFYGHHTNAHLRPKENGPPPSGLLHLRPGTGPGPPQMMPQKILDTQNQQEIHKIEHKNEPQSR